MNIIKSKLVTTSLGTLLLINNEILNTKMILIILDPNMFPKSNPNSFFLAALNDVANSGNDVPNAIAVTPIIKSDIPKKFANEVAPSIKQCEPTDNPIAPIIMQKINFCMLSKDEFFTISWLLVLLDFRNIYIYIKSVNSNIIA